MAVDLRQVFGAFLTCSMFLMLGNMVKRDHIDPLWEPSTGTVQVQERVLKQSANGPWKIQDDQALKPCWKKSSIINARVKDQSNGYIFFSLTHGPEFHASQVANAVMVAKYFGAKLALPDIRGTKSGGKRKFEEIYNVNNFVETLRGIVQVEINPPIDSSKRLTVVRIPESVSKGYIASKVEPIFRRNQNLKIVTDFSNSSTAINGQQSRSSNEPQCLAMFESLKLQPNLQEMVDSMIATMRGLSHKMGGRFIAVDLRVEMLRKISCQLDTGSFSNQCYNAREVGEFLKKIGFLPETTTYLTQRRWDRSLDAIRNIFPSTFTKDAIMPADEIAMYLNSENQEDYEKYIDLYVCTQSDVFVPAFPSRFYYSVVGKRIGDGRTRVLLPSMDGSDSAKDYISPYIAKKSHPAFSCLC